MDERLINKFICFGIIYESQEGEIIMNKELSKKVIGRLGLRAINAKRLEYHCGCNIALYGEDKKFFFIATDTHIAVGTDGQVLIYKVPKEEDWINTKFKGIKKLVKAGFSATTVVNMGLTPVKTEKAIEYAMEWLKTE